MKKFYTVSRNVAQPSAALIGALAAIALFNAGPARAEIMGTGTGLPDWAKDILDGKDDGGSTTGRTPYHPYGGDTWGSYGGGYGSGVGKVGDVLKDVDQGTLILDKLITIGKSVWAIIDQSRPVANVSSVSASAVPAGITDWRQLQGWQNPVSKTFRLPVQNADGDTVYELNFRVRFRTGGNVGGKGHYLGEVTVDPDANLNVHWGQTLNAKASLSEPFNVGTAEDPIAGTILKVEASVSTVFTIHMASVSLYVRGDGQVIQDISSPGEAAPTEVYPIGKAPAPSLQ